jgi:hypothetical protein
VVLSGGEDEGREEVVLSGEKTNVARKWFLAGEKTKVARKWKWPILDDVAKSGPCGTMKVAWLLPARRSLESVAL